MLCYCHWQPEPERAARLTAVLVHGLEGSSDSRYIQGIAMRAFAAGMNVVRMNMRNCGGSDRLTPTLYHSGRSADVGAVVGHFAARFGLERIALVGYSMGGNLVLKLAGEWGAQAPLAAVATVCPAIDLAAGADALARARQPRLRVAFSAQPHAPPPSQSRALPRRLSNQTASAPSAPFASSIRRSLRAYCDFRSADDYYYRAASARVVDRIAVPTLILCAADDPFIRLSPETRARILANPHIHFVETRHGGHCAFLARRSADGAHWAEATVVRYLQAVAPCAPLATPPARDLHFAATINDVGE